MSDPYEASNVLLLPMIGVESGSVFTDLSPSSRTVTRQNDARTTLSQYKFYGSSCYYDGSGDYLAITAAAFDQQFTIELWVRVYDELGTFCFIDTRNAAANTNGFVLHLSSRYVRFSYGNPLATLSGITQFPGWTWRHVALTRDSTNTVRCFLNGVLQFSGVVPNTFDLTSGWRVGNYYDTSVPSSMGWINDLRITNGVARYTTSCAVPWKLVLDANETTADAAEGVVSTDRVAPRYYADTGDGLAASEALLLAYGQTLYEGLLFDASLESIARRAITDKCAISDSSSSWRSRRAQALDAIQMLDTARRLYLQHSVDGVTGIDAALCAVVSALRDTLLASDTATRTLFMAFVDAISLTEALARSFRGLTEDTVQGADTPLTGYTLTLAESVQLTDLYAELRRAVSLVVDGVQSSDDTTGLRTRFAHLTDSPLFVGVLQLGEESYNAWVVNTRSLGISRYEDYRFNSIASGYGCRADGIYQLTGDTDAGAAIKAVITTGLMDFEAAQKKQVPDVFLATTTTGRLVLKVATTDGGNKVEDWYEVQPDHAALDTTRFKLGRGLKARYWQFRLENISGADFELDGMEIRSVVLQRRV